MQQKKLILTSTMLINFQNKFRDEFKFNHPRICENI